MDSLLLIALALLSLLLAFLVVRAIRGPGRSRPSNGDALVVLGIVWVAGGLASSTTSLWLLGLVFLAAGLAQRRRAVKTGRDG